MSSPQIQGLWQGFHWLAVKKRGQHKFFMKLSLLNWKNIQSVQSISRVWLFATPWTAEYQASLSITNSQSLLKLMSIELVMPSNHLIPTLTHHHQPKSIVYIRVHSWCTFYGFGQIYWCMHHYSIMQSSFNCPKNPLLCLCILSQPTSQPLILLLYP